MTKLLCRMQEKTKRALGRWLPLLAWMALIFYFSHQPKGSLPSYGVWDLLVKKGAHVAAYAVLALLARRAGLGLGRAAALAALYAVSDEFHQTFIPGRNGAVVDVLIDLLGVGLGLLLHPWLERRLPQLLLRWGQRDRPGKRPPRKA